MVLHVDVPPRDPEGRTEDITDRLHDVLRAQLG